MLRFENVTKRFALGDRRSVLALDGVDFHLQPGEWVVMLGENGSGKSTFFRLVTGEVFPDSGGIWLNGNNASRVAPHRRARFVTHIHQSRDVGLPRALTVAEVMRLAIEAGGIELKGRIRDDEIARRLETTRKGLSRVIREQIWHLSGGEHQLLSLAVAAALADSQTRGTHVLLLDEHVAHLDPVSYDIVMESTSTLVRGKGMSAIMATHSCEMASGFGDRQVLLSRGRIVDSRSGADRLSAKELKDVLLNIE